MRKFGYLAAFVFTAWFAYVTLQFAPVKSIMTLALSVPAHKEHSRTSYTSEDVECLRQNIFFEARGEGTLGMQMVGVVTIERTKLAAFPESICAVVHERKQFSWTNKKHKINLNNEIELGAWNLSAIIARDLLSNTQAIDDVYKDVAYYHSNSVHPKWANAMKREFVVGNHVFYSLNENEIPSLVLR